MKIRSVVIGTALLALGFCSGLCIQSSRIAWQSKQFEEKAQKAFYELDAMDKINTAHGFAMILNETNRTNCLPAAASAALEGLLANEISTIDSYKEKYGNLKLTSSSKSKLDYARTYEPKHTSNFDRVK